METLDILKVVVLIYVLIVYMVHGKYFSYIRHPLVKGLWIAAILGVFLFVDIVLGIVLGIAFILTLLKYTSDKEMKPLLHVEIPNPIQEDKSRKEHLPEDILKDIPKAQQALEKYVIDDYLKKAAEDGIIKENYTKFPNILGNQYNIQGVEKDMMGYNAL
jgi:hypothetical protein